MIHIIFLLYYESFVIFYAVIFINVTSISSLISITLSLIYFISTFMIFINLQIINETKFEE